MESDLHGHGQLVQVAVVEHAAARSNLKGALLLLFGALHKLLVADDLEPEEPAADGQAQSRKKRQISQKRARLRGMRGPRWCGCGWLRTAANCMDSSCSF